MNHPAPFTPDHDLDMQVEVTCDTCNQAQSYPVNSAKYFAWQERRMLLQDAFAHLSSPERECIKSHICPTCWTAMFGRNPFHG